MADIDVVPKKHSNTWLWVILAIIVLAIILTMTGVFSHDRNGSTNRVGELRTPASHFATTHALAPIA